ncbi:putative damage-inducible protein DinB [Pullulanibacillus pueri]|uniref:Damage-inducible protein DinB n=1 Tax=Pullulanibacillus pueri TaxID=1437324 RepID=A0A8J3EM25_9BACL|nr:DinB family protein [Pullulanibacillus pueri]MBM7680963.1 putative damage-inducible protein DinB [Pullulanibacillus pueri]GGH81513.1 hypothetical protein GCM10007096_19530 [Pullulanibacillus pueri]
MEKKRLSVSVLPGCKEEEISRWLWGLEEVRRDIITKLTGISQSLLDSTLGERQSIGSLLYHIALVEADWLYEEVLCSEWDPEIKALFPVAFATEDGFLSHIEGESLENHFDRLSKVREVFLSHFRSMDLVDWRKPRVIEQYEITPEWVVYHLIEHEAHHRGQIFQLLRELKNEYQK